MSASKNGFKPGSIDWVKHKLSEARADVEMYERFLSRAGVDIQAAVESRAETMLAGALKLDRERRAKPEHGTRGFTNADKIAGREKTAEFLGQFHPSIPRRPGTDLKTAGIAGLIRHGYLRKRGDGFIRTAKRFVVDNIAHEQDVKNASRDRRLGREHKAAPKPRRTHGGHSAATGFDGSKMEKARIIALLLQQHGPLSIKELVPYARRAGITTLTGMVNYVRAGYIKLQWHGNTRVYSFVKLPPGAGAVEHAKTKAAAPAKKRPANMMPGYHSIANRRARHERTKAFLLQFSTETPTRPEYISPENGLPTLVKLGYLRKEGDGWIRIDKPFEFHP